MKSAMLVIVALAALTLAGSVHAATSRADDGNKGNVHGTGPPVESIDGDGLSDGDEASVYGATPVLVDTDFDGMPDGYEVLNGLNPAQNDANGDADGDLHCNLVEYVAGTDPQLSGSAPGSIHVDWRNDTGIEDGSPGNPYSLIQTAINNATAQDVIYVSSGTYHESLVVTEPRLIVSVELHKAAINGEAESPVITYANVSTALLKDLLIRHGEHGVECTGSSPVIYDCRVEYNRNLGVRCYWGSSPSILSSIITHNACTGVECIRDCAPTIANCLIARSGINGVYSYDSDPAVVYCTIADNSEYGIHAFHFDGMIANSVMWGNKDDLHGCSASYCNVEDGDAGDGNISADPQFAAPDYGNYRITASSACIDAGTALVGGGDDFAGDVRSVPDIGFDEYLDTDGDEMQNAWELQNGLTPSDGSDGPGNLDGDALTNVDEFLRGTDPQDPQSPMGTVHVDGASATGVEDGSPANPFTTIQAAIDAAWPGDAVLVAAGAYAENPIMRQAVTVRTGRTAQCTIDAGDGEAALFVGISVGTLEGFTIENAYDGITTVNSSAVMKRCAIVSSEQAGALAVYSDYPGLHNTLILGSSVSGAEAWNDSGLTATNCTVVGGNRGIFAYYSTPVITNSILWDNVDDLVDCAATYSDIGTPGDVAGEGNISADPWFVSGPLHGYYLSQIVAGQGVNSPCVDAGSDTAVNLGLDAFTTRTDGMPDAGIVDMGYHTPAAVPGDVDGNGVVDGLDLTAVISAWECVPGDPLWNPNADLDGNSVVDGLDLAEVTSNWPTVPAAAPDAGSSGARARGKRTSGRANVRGGRGNVRGGRDEVRRK